MTEQPPLEATVAGIHDAIRNGSLTSAELVTQYIDRIAAYDRAGPELNAIVTVNPRASERAAELDDAFESSGFVGPLHGVPVLLKDQIQTAELRTTFGSAAFAEYVPETDATLVTALRDAGAIILAKTNMPDWAAGFVGHSSVQGQTKNPYSLAYDSGGSSAGTGVGIAANLGAIGIGEDTGGSIRVPSSCCNLFGLRVTTGLISRTGLSPLVERMDTPGPMTRTVADMACLLDVIVGFDPDDQRTVTAEMTPDTGSYEDALDPDALENARIGVLRERFGDAEMPSAQGVNERVENALDSMVGAGAQLVDVTVPDLDRYLTETSLHAVAPKHDIDSFLAELDDPPVDSVEELHQSGTYHEALELFETIADAPTDPTTEPTYWERVAGQAQFREELVASIARNEVDAIAFPDVQVPPPEHEALRTGEVRRADYPVNTTIASQSGCPAISVPAGFTDDGLPVGMELLGMPYAEPRLLGLAFAFEQATDPRDPPATAPSLSEPALRD